MKKKTKDMLRLLGWTNNPDFSDCWSKGNMIDLSYEEAVIWELKFWKRAKDSIHICPDCGYKVGIQEFIDNGGE